MSVLKLKEDVRKDMHMWLGLHPESGYSFNELFEISKKSKLNEYFIENFFEYLIKIIDLEQ